MKYSKVHTKRILSLVIALVLALSLVFSVAISASAEGKANEAVVNVKKSVLQINFLYDPGSGMPAAYLPSGSCFLINSTTILTCQHVITAKSELGVALKEYYADKGYDDFKFNPSKLSYAVTVNGGMLVNATLKNSSASDYAILTLNSTVKRDPVVLGDSGSLEKTQPVHILGYPGSAKWLQDSITYTDEKLSITSSTVSNLVDNSGTKYVQFDTAIQGGNSGGPLVDSDGNVVGITKMGFDDQTFQYAVAIDQVKAALDDLGIEYQTPDGNTTDETKAGEEETTVAEETTLAPIATEAPTEVNNGGEGGFDPTLIIIIAIAVVAVIIVVVVILIIVNSKKKSGGNGGNGPMMPPPTPPVPPVGGRVPPVPPAMPSNDGAGETSVLGEGAGETTVLGGQAQGFSLRRKRNSETIAINKNEFIIGKERRRVDYCISDNNSISRAHCKIKVRGGRCYITDLNSTNCTYVNGTRVSPNQEVVLSKGDTIKVSDEEFEFLG